MPAAHQRIVLAAYPVGLPKESDFRREEGPLPRPAAGEMLVRTVFIGLEPRLRLMMNPTTDANRAMRPEGAITDLGKLMPGTVLGEVVESKAPGYRVGDVVEGFLGWQNYAVCNPGGYNRRNNPAGIGKCDLALGPLSAHVGVLGIPGLTAFLALRHEGKLRAGETVVVTTAAGAVGAVAGQLANLAGCRVVGVTGSDAKVRHIVDELGFAAGINYKMAGDLGAAIRQACPQGVDYHFDNVGGDMAASINAQLTPAGRVTRCGIVSKYNKSDREWYQANEFSGQFTVHDHVAEYEDARRQLSRLLLAGKLKCSERIFDGPEQTRRTFIGLLQGENIGKWLVRVGPDPQRSV
ncbi:MAG: NADP-dependent oxidoreductase [Alphaproteobacteria bacterium]|nr:NADP-dependent oxidoreductase [Alphaproteobacteria bacterium]